MKFFIGSNNFTEQFNCHGNQSLYKVIVHSPVEPPHQTHDYVYIELSKYLQIFIEPQINRTSENLRPYNPEVRQCYFNSERKLRFFQIYTQRNCELECMANVTKAKCGCAMFYMPREYIFEDISGFCIFFFLSWFFFVWFYFFTGDNQTKVCGIARKRCMMRIPAINRNCNCLPECTSLSFKYTFLEDRELNHVVPQPTNK